MKNNIASYIAANRIRQNAAQIGKKGRKHAYAPVAVQRDRRPGSGGGNGRVPDSRPVRADGAGDPQDNNKRAEPGKSVKGAGERRVLEAVLPDLPGNYGGGKTWMTSNQPCWAIKRRPGG